MLSSHNRLDEARNEPVKFVQKILDETPNPKGRNAFTSIHVVGPAKSVHSEQAEKTIEAIYEE